jgi:hypothetical protein
MPPKIVIFINTVKILIRGLCIIMDGLTVDGPDWGRGKGVSGAVRVVVDCSGTRGLSLVGATGCFAITYSLKT